MATDDKGIDYEREEKIQVMYTTVLEMCDEGKHLTDRVYMTHEFSKDDIYETIREQTELSERYIRFLEQKSEDHRAGNASQVFKIIKFRPEIADSLYDVFCKYPELISAYASLDLIPHEETKEGSTAQSGIQRVSRVLDTTDPSEVEVLLERNIQFYNALVSKMGNQDWVSTVVVDNVYEINLQQVNPEFQQMASIRVVIKPVDHKVNEFGVWDLYLGSDGVINHTRGTRGDPVGYLFRERENVDELGLMKILATEEFGSPELAKKVAQYKEDGGCGVVEYVYK